MTKITDPERIIAARDRPTDHPSCDCTPAVVLDDGRPDYAHEIHCPAGVDHVG